MPCDRTQPGAFGADFGLELGRASWRADVMSSNLATAPVGQNLYPVAQNVCLKMSAKSGKHVEEDIHETIIQLNQPRMQIIVCFSNKTYSRKPCCGVCLMGF